MGMIRGTNINLRTSPHRYHNDKTLLSIILVSVERF